MKLCYEDKKGKTEEEKKSLQIIIRRTFLEQQRRTLDIG